MVAIYGVGPCCNLWMCKLLNVRASCGMGQESRCSPLMFTFARTNSWSQAMQWVAYFHARVRTRICNWRDWVLNWIQAWSLKLERIQVQVEQVWSLKGLKLGDEWGRMGKIPISALLLHVRDTWSAYMSFFQVDALAMACYILLLPTQCTAFGVRCMLVSQALLF